MFRKRFEGFGFQTIVVENGNDIDEIGRALESAKADKTHPSMIMVRTKSDLAVLQGRHQLQHMVNH